MTVAEVSSFQLETIMDFHPNVSAILNITPDHLNRHGTMENYIEIKERVAANQTEDDCIVLNYDDAVLREFGENPELKPKVCFFSSTRVLKDGIYLDDDDIIYAHSGVKDVVVNVHDLQLLGKHNYENVMAAIAIGLRLGVPLASIRRTVQEFKAVEHRIELVRTLHGVRYYNDSIASSPTRTIAGLNSFHQKLILIAGGYDKKIPFEPLAPKIIEKVKTLILMGVTAPKIEAAVTACEGFDPQQLRILHAKDMQQAVELARQCAQPGDIVSLSPACASFDLYPDFEARGRHFKELVHQL